MSRIVSVIGLEIIRFDEKSLSWPSSFIAIHWIFLEPILSSINPNVQIRLSSSTMEPVNSKAEREGPFNIFPLEPHTTASFATKRQIATTVGSMGDRE